MPLESGSSGHVLVDVLDRVLDKGIVIDAAVRISLVGVELLGVDARVVVASIETYLKHADTIAYTDMAAAPKRAPPLYVEPLETAEALEAGTPDAPGLAAEPARPDETGTPPPLAATPATPDDLETPPALAATPATADDLETPPALAAAPATAGDSETPRPLPATPDTPDEPATSSDDTDAVLRAEPARPEPEPESERPGAAGRVRPVDDS